MFNILDIAPPEPTITETVFSKEIIIALALFVVLVVLVTVVIIKKNKKK